MKQIHFRIPDDVYATYEKELEDTGLPSVTAQIKAEIISQAKIIKQLLKDGEDKI